jgi:hypothetical protein
MGQLLNWSLDFFNLTPGSNSSSGMCRRSPATIASASSTKEAYLTIVLWFIVPKDRSAKNGKRVLALRRLFRRLNVLIAEAFIQLSFKQVAGRRVSVRRDLEGEELSFSD